MSYFTAQIDEEGKIQLPEKLESLEKKLEAVLEKLAKAG